MKRSLLLALPFACIAFSAQSELRVGIIGCDTSHTIAFAETLRGTNTDEFAGVRVNVAYQWGSRDILASTNRYPAYLAKLKGLGVEIVPTIADLLAKCDAVCLETNDGRPHLEQAIEVFKAGKPVFIDKPVTSTLADAVRLVDAARRYDARFFSASTLRFSLGAVRARAGELGAVRWADSYTPAGFEPTHPEFWWYGIHGGDQLFAVLGRGCQSVRTATDGDDHVVTGVWKDSRVGVLHAMPGGGVFGGRICTRDRKIHEMGGYEGYRRLLLEIVRFFRTGVAPLSPDEMLEVYAFLDAAHESRMKNGKTVYIADLLDRAFAEARGTKCPRIIRDLPYGGGAEGRLGDLHFPEKGATPPRIVLLFHDGGWWQGNRQWTEGLARYFVSCGYAVFNAGYVLAGPQSRWPAPGESSRAAADCVLAPEFAKAHRLDNSSIILCGVSSGGHLAVWTGLGLDPARVAGMISLSGPTDPKIFVENKGGINIQQRLFGDGWTMEDFRPMDPIERLGSRGGDIPILLTHVVDDAVIPIASPRSFAAAAKRAGYPVELFEYARADEPNTGGHAIWKPGTYPSEPLDILKAKIGPFLARCDARAKTKAVSARVKTAAVGDVALDCKAAGNWRFALSRAEEADAEIVTVKMTSDSPAVPPPFEISFLTSGAGLRHVWTSNHEIDAPKLWPHAWGTTRYDSQLSCQTPVAVAFGDDDDARLSLACSEAFYKLEYGVSVHERTAQVEGRFRFFTESVPPMSEYVVRLRIDRSGGHWSEAVRTASDWIAAVNGFRDAEVPEAAFDPLYSTWYAYWQDVRADELEREARLASDIGLKTMILDDGWYCDASASIYSGAGDWVAATSRFPDMRKHVESVHRAGLKYLLWVTVPFVGDESGAWERFHGKFLRIYEENSPGRFGPLDPRFREVRDYLIGCYERMVRDWNVDGLKLDYIDQFRFMGSDPAIAENFAGRDIHSLQVATDVFMKDLHARLKALKPDVLIEFRQRYMGPALRQYGNMMRAGDCPIDPTTNRRRICDLRLTSGKMAVHSDMLAWSRDETPEEVARSVLSAIFGVVQYSMILDGLPTAHREVMRHWIGFAQRHRSALLRGNFRPHHPELGYPIVEAWDANERLLGVYLEGLRVDLDTCDRPTFVLNATGSEELTLQVPHAARVVAFDCRGREVSRCTLASGLNRVSVPRSGFIRLGR